MNPVKISVVIPSYNKAKFIKKTLDSVLNQNYSYLEVIIQDGGSTDGTLEIIKEYQKKYKEVISFQSSKDGGQLDAINSGLKKAKGDILTFINADDTFEKDAFFVVSEYYKENPDGLWFAGKGRVVDERDNEIMKLVTWYKNFLLYNNTFYMLLTTNYLMQPSVFLTKKAYKKYGPFTGTKNFVLEYDLWLSLSKVKMPIVINQFLSNFRIESTTKTMNMGKNILSEDLKIVKRYTTNKLILFLHLVHNKVRLLISKFI